MCAEIVVQQGAVQKSAGSDMGSAVQATWSLQCILMRVRELEWIYACCGVQQHDSMQANDRAEHWLGFQLSAATVEMLMLLHTPKLQAVDMHDCAEH